MDVVDAQIHSNVLGPPETLLQIMDALGIQGAIIDEYAGAEEEGTRLLPDYRLADGTSRPIGPNAEAAALKYPERLKYLMRVNPFDPGLEGWVESLAASPNLVALRAIVFGRKAGTAFEAGEFDRLFRIALKHNQPVFVTAPARVKHLAPYARRFPDLKLIIDHCGVAFDAPRGQAPIDDSLTLAQCPNVAFKWAHAAVFMTTDGFPYPALDPKLRQVVDSYGPERVMYASDYTVTRHRSNWAESLFHLRISPALSDGDREWVLGRACRRWVNWPAPAEKPALPPLHSHNARSMR
ncbi:MAG TPA: amidohydrolase family protein [Alphaproteobacteria bacterium]|nr:amidohydrolase family protein [Alphaproteobacteria bacterium]